MVTTEIQLTRGYIAIVDEVDADLATAKWFASGLDRQPYAARHLKGSRAHRNRQMLHRVVMERILGRKLNPGQLLDHVNGNTLDTRRENLRLATRSENAHNSKLRANNTSGFKGVCFSKRDNKWAARIQIDGRMCALGYYDTPELAAKAYADAAQKRFGNFAKLDELPNDADSPASRR